MTETALAPRSRNPKPLIDQETLKKLVRYDGRTGQFRWSDNPPRGCIPGAPAGSVMPDKTKRRAGKGSVVRVIRLNGRLYSAARLVWLYVTGEFPDSYLTFNDNDPTNLRFHNLCETSDKFSTTREAAYQRDYHKRLKHFREYGVVPRQDPAVRKLKWRDKPSPPEPEPIPAPPLTRRKRRPLA